VRDDAIVEQHHYFDMLTLMSQLEAMLAAA